MAQGIAVYDDSGQLVWDTNGILGRLVGFGTATYVAFEVGYKYIVISGMIDTDELIVYAIVPDAPAIRVYITRSGDTVTFNRPTAGIAPSASSYRVVALRKQ
jgi:hypothetical protein